MEKENTDDFKAEEKNCIYYHIILELVQEGKKRSVSIYVYIFISICSCLVHLFLIIDLH